MKLITYQSIAVLKILEGKRVYRANPSISFKKEYGALIKLLNLKCSCPIFTVVKNKKHNTSGKISGSVRLVLDVPNEFVKLTEFGVWADLMFNLKYTRDDSVFKLTSIGHDIIGEEQLKANMEHIKTQKRLEQYKYPQAVLEEIRPEWLESYSLINKSKEKISFLEKIGNIFRK